MIAERDPDDVNQLLYKFIYHALLEIREEALLIDNNKVYKISDLIHNLPMQLRNKRNPEALLERLKEDAKSMKIENWFNNVLDQL